MIKYQKLASLILSIFSVLLLIPTAVFAWMAYVDKRAISQFEASQIVLTTKVNDTIIENINLTGLTYIDLTNDIVNNKYNNLNDIASVIHVQVINGEQSIDIKNSIDILQEQTQIGLFYLIIYDGKNIDYPTSQLPVNNDYKTKISQIIGLETDEQLIRDAISSYNQTTLQSVYNDQLNSLSPNEWISFKIAIWGDYNKLTDKTTYLTKQYSLQLRIRTIQVEGDLA